MCEFCNIDRAMTEVSSAQHSAWSEWFWAELVIIGERWNVLEHPFYVRWSQGRLSRRELQLYAEEYDHLVVALASVSDNAATKAEGLLREVLEAHAAEEWTHIDLWRNFARATGWCPSSVLCYGADPHGETVEWSRVWAGDASRSLAKDLATLYAIESPQPRIASTKLDGLLGPYGFDEGPGTEYFRPHAELDLDHAALAQSALDGMLASEDPFGLLTQAESVYRGYWSVLDSLEGLSCR